MSIFKRIFGKKDEFEPEEMTPDSAANESLKFEARDLLAQGKKIQAIKLVRAQTGWGLKQAKDFVDSLV